jgi:hypothetical protein
MPRPWSGCSRCMTSWPSRAGSGPVARLLPTTAATTLRKGREEMVIDGPFAETKEQLLGFYIVDCASLEEALDVGKGPRQGQPGHRQLRDPAGGAELHESQLPDRGEARGVSDLGWIDRDSWQRPARRRWGRCCATSATSTRPRKPSRKPACVR